MFTHPPSGFAPQKAHTSIQPTTPIPQRPAYPEYNQKINDIAQSYISPEPESNTPIYDYNFHFPTSPTSDSFLKPKQYSQMPPFHFLPPPTLTQSSPLPLHHEPIGLRSHQSSDLPHFDPMPSLFFPGPPPLAQSAPLPLPAQSSKAKSSSKALFREPVGVRTHQDHPMPSQKNRPLYRRATRSPVFPLTTGATLGVLSGLFLGCSTFASSLIIPGLLLSLFAIPLIGLGAIWCLLRRSNSFQN